MNHITTIRIIIALCCLSIASYQDIKVRRASNIFWVVMGVVGILLLFDGFDPYYLIAIPLLIGLFYLMFQADVLSGGADAKALMALAVLLPYPIYGITPPVILVFLYGGIFTVLCIPVLLYLKKEPLKQILFKYPFPFMLSLLVGVIAYSCIGDVFVYLN